MTGVSHFNGGDRMNKIFKIIFSKARGCYVVVSELAKSSGSGTPAPKIRREYGRTLTAAVMAALMGMAFVGAADITTVHDYSVNSVKTDTDTNYNYDADTGSNALAAGVSAKATGASAVAVGSGAQASENYSVAIGNGAQANNTGAIALGNNAIATGIGAMVIGQYNTAEGQNSLAFGGGYNDENKGNKAISTAAVAFGERSQALSEGSVAFGYGTQAGNMIKDKNNVKYTGQNAVAFGNGTKALGGRSLAFGENTTANYNDSVAFGNGATAFSSGATAFGNRSRALSQYSTSFGDNSVAAGSMSFAFGTDTIAGAALDDNGALELTDGSRMDSYGNKAYTTTDTAGNKVTYSIKGMDIPSGVDVHDYVVVTGTKADGTTGTYVQDYQGGIAEVKVNDDGTVTKVKDLYSGKYGGWYQYDENGKLVKNANGIPVVTASADMKSIPVTLDKATPGSNGYTLNGFKNATAFGYSTEASGDNATAFGNDTKAKASAATAFGTTTTASGDNATAFGLSTTASGKQTTAFGSSTTASGDNATAFGENSTASGEAATAFGIGSTASGKNSLAGLGGTASNENSIALGKDTKADNADSAVSVAIGQNAEASGAQSLAIGFGNVSETDQFGNTPYPVSATQAAAKGAIAIGINTGAKGEHSIAMGSYTDAAKDSSVAIGFDTHAVEDSSVAIGSGTKAAGRYSVALGLSSIAGTETSDEKNPLDGGGSVAMGYAASAEASRSIAIGTGATAADSQFTTAVGDSTTAQAEGSVAIGAGSIATRGAGNKESIVSTDINTGKTTITYGDEKKAYLKPDTLSTDKISTWGSTTGAVSVGGQATYKEYDDNGNLVKKTKLLTRQITNVAAGSDDTDAVNVAQLKAAQPTVTSNDHSVTIATSTDLTDYHKNYDLKIATATLSQDKTTGDNPVETGKVTVSNPKISVIENGETKQVDNPNAYVTGNSVANAINNSGFKLTASASEGVVTGNKETLIHPGDTVTIDAGKNISLTQDKGKISIATKDNLNLGSADSKDDKQQDVPGTNGSITVNGRNGSSVAISGQDGSIGLTGPKGTDGTSTSIQMSTIMSDPTLDDGKNTKTTSGEGEQQTTTTQAPRIQYKNGNTTYEVATMDDGQKYAGDVQASDAKANAFSRKLNEQTNIVGGVKNLDALSTGKNVGVVSNGKDTLTIRLAKKLTDLTSVTTVTKDDKGNKTSETVQNGNGITIIPSTLGAGKTTVSLTDNGLSNGGNQITHVDSGLKDAAGHEVELKNATGDVLNNAVNVGDLKKVQNVASAHTAVTVNGGVGAPDAEADGNLGSYTDKEKGNLLLAQKKDTTTGQITYDLKLNDNVILGKDGSDGKDGQEGTIGLTGKDGLPGTDGKQGYSTTIIKTEKGQKGKDGKTGKKNLGGTDITRIVYTDKDGSNPQTVATLGDGLKFAGDDISKTVDKKLNDTLQIRGDGSYDKTTQKTKEDGNIQVSADTDTGTIKVALNKNINLKQNGSLTVGGDMQDGSTTGQDPIIIKHFDAGDLTVKGTDKDDKTPQSKAGDYVTGLDNKDWDVDHPTYVSGRAATEDQLKEVSNAVTKATETAGKHTVVTVEGGKDAGTTDYNGENLKLKVTDTAGQKTYDLKLNDNLSLGTIGKDGEKGTDGSIGLKGADGKSSIGLNGRDGISVIGKDGKNGVSITGSNGLNGKDGIDGKIAIGTPGKDAVSISGQNGEGHIGLTGPTGKDGKDASADIHVKNGQVGVDGTDGNNGKDGMDRIVYDDHNGKPHEVATMDDGLKFVGNDDQEVTRKLNETLSIKGGLDKDAVAKASTKNLGVRQNATKDGLEIVMTDTPDFTKVTVGEGNDTTGKITIGKQTVTGKKSDGSDGAAQTGNYITGLDNKAWDKDNVVENRAATEGQLKAAINDIKGSANGGFGLADGKGGTVKKDLGDTVTVKGDGKNIETTVKVGALEVSLKKDVDLGQNGSIKAGETTINSDGVDTNKVTIKDSSISISKDGINGGSKQITNVASGASEIIKGEGGKDVYKYDNDTNAANIGDVKRIAGDMKTEINNNISNVTNKVDQIGQHVDNIQKDVTQLQQDVKADRTYQGDDGAAKKVKVKFGSFLSLTGGAKLADLTEEGNIGVVQKEIEDPDHKGEKIAGLSVRLAKHLNLEKTTYTSEENGQTYTSEIDGKGLTIKTGDENRNITVQDGNVNMGGNQIHHVAPGQAPDDAVNVSQLNATNYAVNKLDTRVNRVGANAAALAALHPLDFDPDDKWDFSAGYGHYKDANAAAVGAFYRPNEDTMFSVGGSFGGGENMVNAGVSVKLGQGNHVSTSRVAMAKEIKDLKKDVAALKAVVNQQSALIDKLTGVNAGEFSGSDDLFPDVPANHWAYEYVTRLREAGILTGYPDGNFAGDRMMTRYEFAAIVYRAIMAGAAANPSLNKDGTLDRLSKEFSSEMKYIRIDTIRKDRNGRPTIQRVRVIKEDENKA